MKRARAHVKRWVVIFTCLVTRAVNLEVASFLNTDACINAIRRFICHRGSIKSIRSDRGTNFIGTQKEQAESMKLLEWQRALLKEGIDWTFNPPSGPHHGGVLERPFRLVKKILYSILKDKSGEKWIWEMFGMITSWDVHLGAKRRMYVFLKWLFLADSTKTLF